MSLIRRVKKERPLSILIPLREAAEMLCLDESTVRQGKTGTASLTKVRQGTGVRARVFLIRTEVQEHLASLIETAKRLNEKSERHVWR